MKVVIWCCSPTAPAQPENFPHRYSLVAAAAWTLISATSQISASHTDPMIAFPWISISAYYNLKIGTSSGGTLFTSFDSLQIRPSIAMDYFISANQQLRFSLQWIGIVAESEFWRVPTIPGRLLPRTRPVSGNAEDFTVSQMTSQLRYRWEIAPLSDLFVVYTRGSNLPYQDQDDFGSLFQQAFNRPIIDTLTIKLRYRFSS